MDRVVQHSALTGLHGEGRGGGAELTFDKDEGLVLHDGKAIGGELENGLQLSNRLLGWHEFKLELREPSRRVVHRSGQITN